MKIIFTVIFCLALSFPAFTQDNFDDNNDGFIEPGDSPKLFDFNGDGIADSKIPPDNFVHPGLNNDNPKLLNFYQYWI